MIANPDEQKSTLVGICNPDRNNEEFIIQKIKYWLMHFNPALTTPGLQIPMSRVTGRKGPLKEKL